MNLIAVTVYETELYTVTDVRNSQITAENDDGKRVVRDSTKFKRYTGTVGDDKGGLPRQKPKPSDTRKESKQESPVARRRTRQSGPPEDQPWIMKKGI